MNPPRVPPTAPPASLPEGAYTWHLVALKSGAAAPPPATFTLAVLRAPELLRPADGESRTLKSRDERATFEFAWACKSVPAVYRLEIRSAATTTDKSVEDCAQKVDLPAGRHRWRVGLSVEGKEKWSDWREVHVSDPPVLRLTKPTPKRRNLQVTLAFRNPPRDPASVGKSIVNPPLLDWQPVRTAAAYLVQFAPAPDFARLLSEEKTRASRLIWHNAVPGRTYWRVAALTAEGEAGPFSEAGTLDVNLPSPALEKIYRFQPEPGRTEPLRLQWPSVPLAGAYLVQVAPKRNLAGAQSKVVTTGELTFAPEVGTRFVRVATVDAAGAVTSGYSNVARVDVVANYTLDAPKTLLPKSGTRAATRGPQDLNRVFAGRP